jgi:hypothetical protein
MVVAGDLVVLFGDFKRAAEGVRVERGVLAAIADLRGAGVVFGLRIGTGTGMREGGEPWIEVGLA